MTTTILETHQPVLYYCKINTAQNARYQAGLTARTICGRQVIKGHTHPRSTASHHQGQRLEICPDCFDRIFNR